MIPSQLSYKNEFHILKNLKIKNWESEAKNHEFLSLISKKKETYVNREIILIRIVFGILMRFFQIWAGFAMFNSVVGSG